MGKFIDLIGMRFGRLTVIKRANYNDRGSAVWTCRCDCGNFTDIVGGSLRNRNGTRSCGCIQKEIASERHFEDLTGKRFGDNVTVIRRIDDLVRDNGRKIVQWLCVSDGGEEFVCEPYSLKHMKHHIEKIYYIPEMKDLFSQYGLTEQQMKENTPNGNKKIAVTCPECKRQKEITPGRLLNQGLGCICNDNTSYLEKYFSKFLDMCSIDYKYQKTFSWSHKKRYDFYIKKLNMIIEPGGLQHIEGWSSDKDEIDKIQANDEFKQNLALDHGIRHYVFFISKSEPEKLKQAILDAVDQNGIKLLDILNVDINDIDLKECEMAGLCNLSKVACELYASGLNIKDIAIKLRKNPATIRKWIQNGADVGWCIYNPLLRHDDSGNFIGVRKTKNQTWYAVINIGNQRYVSQRRKTFEEAMIDRLRLEAEYGRFLAHHEDLYKKYGIVFDEMQYNTK